MGLWKIAAAIGYAWILENHGHSDDDDDDDEA